MELQKGLSIVGACSIASDFTSDDYFRVFKLHLRRNLYQIKKRKKKTKEILLILFNYIEVFDLVS